MIIKELHIYGFGKWIDTTISFSDGLVIVQGDNEAGKSTLRAFILSMLFGFPSKVEKRKSYRPKEGSRYGGRMIFISNEGKQFTLERIEGRKVAGDVKIRDEAGVLQDDRWLEQYLHRLDKTTYQDIFCFGAEDWSELQQLKADSLNQYLYEAGMTGTKHMMEIEKEMTQEAGSWFKPQGRKPVINQLLASIKEKKAEIVRFEQDLEEYENLQEKVKTLQEQIKDRQKEMQQLYYQKEWIRRKKMLQQTLSEKEELEAMAEVYQPYEKLPSTLKQQWESIQDRKRNAEQMLEEAEAEYRESIKSVVGKSCSLPLHKEKHVIHDLKENLPLRESNKQETEQLALKLERITSAKKKLFQKLEVEDESSVPSQLPSIAGENDFHSILSRKQTLQENIYLSSKEAEKLEQQKAFYEREKEKKASVPPGDETVSKQPEEVMNGDSSGEWSKLLFFLKAAAFIFTVLGLWELFTGSWFEGMTMLVAGIAALVLFLLQKQQDIQKEKQQSRTDQEKHMEAQHREQALAAIDQNINLEARRIESVLAQLDKEMQEQKDLELELAEWCSRWGLPAFPLAGAEDYFQAWKNLKNEIENEKEAEEELAAKQKQVNDVDQGTVRLYERLRLEKKLPTAQSIHYAADLLKQEEEHLLQVNSQVETAEKSRLFLKKWSHVNEQLEQEQHDFLQSYEWSSEEELLQAAEGKEKYQSLQQRRQMAEAQWRSQVLAGEQEEELIAALKLPGDSEEELKEADNHIRSAQESIQSLHEDEAAAARHIYVLEEGGGYEQLLQQYQNLKESLSGHMYRWKVWNTAVYLMEEAKSVHEKERQPEVLKKASDYFQQITAGEHVRVFSPMGEETIMVESAAGIVFTPEELSYGTAEQLYLSLRLSLAEIYEKQRNDSIPMTIDDAFAHFDAARRREAFTLLSYISRSRQVIYFTCHDYAEVPGLKDKIIVLDKGDRGER
ncbi:uncharacterized protein YhaN [Sinobaca qinghaiensis]|uniref:Uncharacterized protein YhaN n=1 Tax=Sinobaca qinghaiensis TaxID=342944 RepID=A0A419V3T5_9BACL|nr:AAA family ATPase [Sinobaca qinghaiensis]RKD73140.1 uncharacterized protein YhaN [Sinobaca qinghaiensis]